jgi:hypothetical protein
MNAAIEAPISLGYRDPTATAALRNISRRAERTRPTSPTEVPRWTRGR